VALAGGLPAERGVERPPPAHADDVVVRVVPGPQQAAFDEATRRRFFESRFRLSSSADRVGARLEGPALPAARREIVSDGMLPGCIQVLPDGQPVVMLADAPTTGGYPKIATVVTPDLPLLAQLVPGEGHVRFRKVVS
jgi:allophanate hydrolase subunit 2